MEKTNKKIRVANPAMFTWLFVPILTLFFVTNYFFQTPKNEVLGASTESKPTNTTEDSRLNINQKFDNFKLNSVGIATLVFTGVHRSQYEIAYPELDSRGFSGAISVPTNDVDLIGSMTWLNIKLLQFKGWEVISQSKNQICSKDELKNQNILDDEISGSKQILTDLGFVVNLYLPPCGVVTPAISKTVNDNYKGLISFGIQTNSLYAFFPYNLVTRQVNNTVNTEEVKRWIKNAKLNNSWLILSFPDISETNDTNSVSTKLLNATLDAVAESKLQVVVPGEILKYDKK